MRCHFAPPKRVDFAVGEMMATEKKIPLDGWSGTRASALVGLNIAKARHRNSTTARMLSGSVPRRTTTRAIMRESHSFLSAHPHWVFQRRPTRSYRPV
jgi:hypothetical protein